MHEPHCLDNKEDCMVQRGCQDGCGACLVQTRRGINTLVIKTTRSKLKLQIQAVHVFLPQLVRWGGSKIFI